MGNGNKGKAVRCLLLGGVSLGSLLLAGAAAAQSGTVQEVVVTAQKREQAAQDVPIALSVVSEKTLSQARVVSIEDLARVTPNLEVVNTGGAGSYTAVARGVTNLVSSPESTSVLGLYVDEAPVSAFGATLPDAALYDIARVEFLRGPQGTLFGEGSEAGTLRLITNKPDSRSFSGKAEVTDFGTKGGDDSYNARAAVNIPLVRDQLALRIVGSYREDGGWIDVPDLGQKNTNEVKQSDVRAALRWTPVSKLVVDASWTHDSFRAKDQFEETSDGVYKPSALGPLLGAVAAGPVRALSPNRYHYDLFNGTLNYDLGPATLVSSTSYYKQSGSSYSDLSPAVPPYLLANGLGPYAAFPGQADKTSADQSKLTTEEVRLVSDGDHTINYTIGAFFRRQERTTNQGLVIALLAPAVTLANQTAVEATRDNAYAVFGQVDYKLTPTLTATAGVRYYHDDRTTNTTNGVTTTNKASDKAWSPNFVLNWKADPNVTLFVKAARGFRQGGTNAANAFDPAIPSSFGPESLWSYEAGAKTRLAPWLTANVYAFYNDWKDLQVSAVAGFFGFTQNGGKARSQGVEADLLATPAEGLSLGANLSYSDAKITGASAQAAAAGLAKGDKIPYVPKLGANLFADYRRPVYRDWFGFVRGEYQHRDSTYSDVLNTPNLRNDAVDRFNLRLGVDTGRWRVSLFAENLGDHHDTTSKSYVLLPKFVVATPMRPRTLGVSLSAAF